MSLRVVYFLLCVRNFYVLSLNDDQVKCTSRPGKWQDVVCCDDDSCPKKWSKQPLLVVSFDGFRADYLLRNSTPSIQTLNNCSSRSAFMYPSFPSETFPNHYTVFTGLYPESHGIIHNSMHDSTMQPNTFKYGITPNASKWWGGEPLWYTIRKIGMKSAAYFWPGSDNSAKPANIFFSYNESVPFVDRVDQVIKWLLLNDSSRPDLVTLYFHEPDITGHIFGPESPEMERQLVVIDGVLDYLMSQLFSNNLLNCINLVVLSDHGMQSLSKEFLSLSKYISDVNGLFVYEGPVGGIFLENSIAKNLTCKYNHSLIYKLGDIPTRFHLNGNSISKTRMGDIVVIMDPGYLFVRSGFPKSTQGTHGYDYASKNMRALFIAYGPKFKRNFEIEPFQNIELYNLFCDVLEIPYTLRQPNNGTYGVLHRVLRNPPTVPPKSQNVVIPACPFVGKIMKSCGSCNQVKELSRYFQSNNPDSILANFKCVSDSSCIAVCQAAHTDHSLLYWNQGKIPVLMQYFIAKNSIRISANNNVSRSCINFATDFEPNKCPQNSSSLKENHSNISLQSLNSFVTKDESQSLYTFVPMLDSFYDGPWSWLQKLVITYIVKYDTVLIMTGPIFDSDSDGLLDPLDLINSKYKLTTRDRSLRQK